MLTYLTLKEAAEVLPGHPTPCTVHRWCRRGVPVRGTSRRAKLKHIYVGRRMFTSREWVEDFLAALDADSRGGTIRRRRPSRAGRKRALAEADAILREAGI